MQTEPTTLLEPFTTVEDEMNVAGLLVPSLTNLEFRGELVHVPALAERWEWSDDGRTLTFHLRSALWDDGEPITAADVAFTFRILRDERFASPRRSSVLPIDSVEAAGPREVRFRFAEAAYRETMLADTSWGILPEHVYGAMEPKDARGSRLALEPVGHGPFRLVHREGTRVFVLERNERCVTEPVPHLKRVTFVATKDTKARLDALLSGAVDALDGVSPEDLARCVERGFRVIERGRRSVDFVMWNLRREPLSDARVRRAVTLAIDRDGINAAFFRVDGETLATQPIGTVPPVLEGTHPDDVVALPFDPRAAEETLDAAGWRREGSDGTRQRDGKPFAIELLVNQETSRRVATARMIQQDLKRVGIDVRVEPLAFSALQKRLEAEDFDASIYGFNAALRLTQSDTWGSRAYVNHGGYEDAEVERIVRASDRESDPARLRALLQDLQRRIYPDQPFTFLCWFSRFVVVRDRFQDLGANVIAFTSGLGQCWVPPERQKTFQGQ